MESRLVFEVDTNASNAFQVVQIWIRMLRIHFEWFEYPFECFESLSIGSNLDSNASNPFRMDRIWILMLRVPFEWIEFGFEFLESLSNGSNLDLNASNPFRMLQIPFKWFQFALK